ncbi:hypothetical protein [Hyphomicrobium sp.]|uniref:hypothetical protein n=1 Tax=Hyphomicrobium sp. TaxID=82 RepID=UPI002E305C61|nr:hypothetical protein [Hyphomicrobium sp.]HEX2841402.1 hypothetical protein [Hyphomicrobium sp.]
MNQIPHRSILLEREKEDTAFLIAQSEHSSQSRPHIERFRNGFIVAWMEEGVPRCEIGCAEIRAKLFSWTGEPIGPDFYINSETIFDQRDPKVAALPDGGFVAVWEDFSGRGDDSCNSCVRARVFSSSGSPLHYEIAANADTNGRQFNPVVSPCGKGGFVIAWMCGEEGNKSRNVKARLFTSAGMPLGSDITVGTPPISVQSGISIAGVPTGEFFVVWQERVSSGGRVKGTIVQPDGTRILIEIAQRAANDQSRPAACALDNGMFVAAWCDGRHDAIVARSFNTRGQPSSDFRISTELGKVCSSPAIAPVRSDAFLVTWAERDAGSDSSEFSRIKARAYGIGMPDELLVSVAKSDTLSSPVIAALTDDRFIVVWEDGGALPGAALKGRMFSTNER